VKQYDDGDQLGEAGTGPAPQQAPTAAGFSWSSAKPSAPPPSQQTAAQGPTTTGPTTGRFGWSPPTKVARPQQMLPPTGSTQPSAPSASAPFPHTRPAQPPPVSPNGSTAAASTIQLGYQHTQPSAHGPTAVSSSTASLLDRAKANDEQALATLFGQFISNHEQIIDSQYLGVLGMWRFGMHSFAAVTTHRIASIRISIFGRVHYQDGALECINSSELGQPSLLGLYLYMGSFFVGFALFRHCLFVLFFRSRGAGGATRSLASAGRCPSLLPIQQERSFALGEGGYLDFRLHRPETDDQCEAILSTVLRSARGAAPRRRSAVTDQSLDREKRHDRIRY
jgi:hypothetical protein